MNEDVKVGATFIAQVYKLETRKDGSCRLTIEAGSESIEDIQWLQRLAVRRDASFQVAMVPLDTSVTSTKIVDV